MAATSSWAGSPRDTLIQEAAVLAAGCDVAVVVLNTGGPVLMPWLDRAGAVVAAWLPGQQFGEAVAAVLFGDADAGAGAPVARPGRACRVCEGRGMANDPQEAAEDPREAGAPRTTGPTRAYEGDRIRVLWDAGRCIHVGRCLRALPAVFDVQARPWIDLEGAAAEEVAAAVRICPTGALRYQGLGDLPDEAATEPVSVEVRPNGPLYVRGRVRVTRPGGDVVADELRVALCRCGASQNKPFCDNSHRLIGFRG